jgi:hypothetical protein
MNYKEFFVLLKALFPAILSVLLVIGTAIYFQHQTNVERQKCVDSGGVIIRGYGDTCIPKELL